VKSKNQITWVLHLRAKEVNKFIYFYPIPLGEENSLKRGTKYVEVPFGAIMFELGDR
jgi:hypothetical protein